MPEQTPSQTIGPFFAFALTPEAYGKAAIAGNVLVSDDAPGERIRIHGQVLDGDGEPVKDALLEIWQADSDGHYAYGTVDGADRASTFVGFGRRGTDDNGMYSFMTIKPGSVVGPSAGPQAPHIAVIVFARGMLSHAYTRMYFSDEAEANGQDPVLSSVPAERRRTLLAERDESRPVPRYRFDIHLQGEEETVFFDV